MAAAAKKKSSSSVMRKVRMRTRMAFLRKLVLLRTFIHSNSVKESSIIMDAFVYISALKLKLDALTSAQNHILNLTNTCNHLLHLPLPKKKVVKVEKVGTGFMVMVTNDKEKGEDDDELVSILGALDEMRLVVTQARVSCNHDNGFHMEAAVEPYHEQEGNNQQPLNIHMVAQAILKVIHPPTS